MKLVTKILSNCLRPVIPTLIDHDQTGFVHGRSIAENFVYAADLLSCCHRRRAPTVVLKLDFKKAFDLVSWDRLDVIMHARGFGSIWCDWITRTLRTGKMAILLNGVAGHWFQCRRGLHQGDLISPYLFVIVADVLQRLLRKAASDGSLCHPIDPKVPCPVLQYADDTLILLKGDTAGVARLKQLLDSFSRATGLHINFHKSTFVPMNINYELVQSMAGILGYPISSFPQTYLGLPLSPTS